MGVDQKLKKSGKYYLLYFKIGRSISTFWHSNWKVVVYESLLIVFGPKQHVNLKLNTYESLRIFWNSIMKCLMSFQIQRICIHRQQISMHLNTTVHYKAENLKIQHINSYLFCLNLHIHWQIYFSTLIDLWLDSLSSTGHGLELSRSTPKHISMQYLQSCT